MGRKKKEEVENIDEHTGKTKEVPGLIVETEVQKAEWEGGIKRTELQKRKLYFMKRCFEKRLMKTARNIIKSR